MKLLELVGKQVIRTAPIIQRRILSNLFNDSSYEDIKNYTYTTEPVFVAAASETHAIIIKEDIKGQLTSEIIGVEFNDDCWTEYSELAYQAREMIKNKFSGEKIEVPGLQKFFNSEEIKKLKTLAEIIGDDLKTTEV